MFTLFILAALGAAPAQSESRTSGTQLTSGTSRTTLTANVELSGEARVRGTELTLGAVATVRCDTPETRARLEAHAIGWAPAPGFSRVLASAQLERELEMAFPGLDIVIDRTRTCRVLPETRRLGAAEIEQAAQHELAQLFIGRDAHLRTKTAARDLDVPAPREKLELRAVIDRRELRAGDWNVPVQLWIDGYLYQTVWQTFAVELWAEVPALVRDVTRGELLGPELVELRRVQLEGDAITGALDASALSGAVALRDLPRGSAITSRDVRRAQLVTNGEPVTLEVRKGGITARSTCICRQDGALGDKVKVATNDKSRELNAQVVGRALVRIEL